MTDRENRLGTGGGRARLTPYELVFTEGDFESVIFPRIGEEARAQESDLWHRERFDFLSTAADVIRELVPDDAPPDALDQYRALLFHAFHHWNGGKRLFVLETAVARYLVESGPKLAGWMFRSPAPSVYVQLPANLFWSSISPEVPPEPVDGLFVTTATDKVATGLAESTAESDWPADGAGYPDRADLQHIDVLLILGLRRGRAGFSVIPVTTHVGEGVPVPWDTEERADGDFRNTLPGGEIDGLYSILTTSEVLKLMARIFWYLDAFPDSAVEVASSAPPAGVEEAPSSQLSYSRVVLTSPDSASQP